MNVVVNVSCFIRSQGFLFSSISKKEREREMQEILEEHCRFLRGKRVTSDDIREGLVELVRGDKYRRFSVTSAFSKFRENRTYFFNPHSYSHFFNKIDIYQMYTCSSSLYLVISILLHTLTQPYLTLEPQADDYVGNVLKDLVKANVNLPTYLSTSYEIPYFPGLREDSSMKVPKKWIDEKEVRNVLERFEKSFEVVFSAPTDTKVPVDFVAIVGMIRSVIPTKRLYDIRAFNVPQGNVLVQGSNMLCAFRIYIDKETRTLDLGYASRESEIS